MAKITAITKPALPIIGAEVEAALAKVSKKLGVSFKYRGGTYSGGLTGALRLELIVVQAGQEGKDARVIQAEAEWEQYAKSLGLKPKWLGKKITFRDEKVTILGLLINRPKFPIVVQGSGKPFLLPTMTVKNAFNQRSA